MPTDKGPQQVIAERLERLEQALAALMQPGAGVDEGIHDVRVATRRLGAALDLLTPVAKGKVRATRDKLSALRRDLSQARDAEVALGVLAQEQDGVTVSELDRARRVLAGKVEAGRVKAVRRVAKEAQRIVQVCAAVRVVGSLHADDKLAVLRRLERRATHALTRARKVTRKAKSVAALHQARVAFKHLRYGLEVAEDMGLIPPLPARHDALRTVQDAAGAVMDLQLTANALEDVWSKNPYSRSLHQEARNRCRLLSAAITRWSHGKVAQRLAPAGSPVGMAPG